MKNLLASATIGIALLTSGTLAQAAQNKQCLPMGGVAIANLFSEGKGKPVIISATLTGSVNTAAGKITAQKTTATGLVMEMEHYFGKDDGGHIYTKDRGVLTAIPGKPGRYMVEITYIIKKDVTRGTLKGYAGQFKSYGLADLRDPDDMKVLVRYSGEICKGS